MHIILDINSIKTTKRSDKNIEIQSSWYLFHLMHLGHRHWGFYLSIYLWFGYISQEKIYSSRSWMGMVLQVNEVFYSLEPPQTDLNTVYTYYIPDSKPIRLYTVSVKIKKQNASLTLYCFYFHNSGIILANVSIFWLMCYNFCYAISF